jgi:hypothetical protein
MSRHLRDLLTLLDKAVYTDDYGVYGSTFYVCRYCESESGAGVLMKPDWHKDTCPIPRMQRKYANKGAHSAGEKAE